MMKIPCVYMRGGTSKAIIFHKKDLPDDQSEWKNIFLKVMGTPDVKQIDGMGGTVSSTSKVAVISPSSRPGVDVDYYFVQVEIERPIIADNLNCGNISSAVGPFAIDEGLVEAKEPVTVVRIFNENTQRIIESHVRVENGKAAVYGNETIMGVPGTASRIDLYFEKPGGASTGKTFPTGKRKETLDIPGFGLIEASLIDISNPAAYVRAKDVGMKGTELTEINSNVELLDLLERIRCVAAEKMGFVSYWEDAITKCTSIPKVGIISEPQDYTSLDGRLIAAESMDLCCRMISVGTMHKAYPMTYAVGTGAAARISGTIPFELARKNGDKNRVVLGHVSGCTEVLLEMDNEEVEKAGVVRTARRIMEGYIYIK
ncbi:MAG TPA: 3-methylitaconate isomerase [Christensenellaceae bacterium]|jgi:2-methylaconitate cis-trans-isomerase PrpF|nr:3-methylitaconate isomerase [Christensenellaceae bacterium]